MFAEIEKLLEDQDYLTEFEDKAVQYMDTIMEDGGMSDLLQELYESNEPFEGER